METLIEEFKTYFVRIGKSPTTIKSYSKDLRLFFREKQISKVSQINRNVINDWVLTLREHNLTDGTIANRLWAIKGFLKWLHAEKQIECYTFDVKIPFVKPPAVVEYLEPEELEKIYSFINIEELDGLRLRTYIEVMINTGLRPSEALNLRRDQIAGDEFIITGKGKKERKIYFNNTVHYWVDLYLYERGDTCPEVFITHPLYASVMPQQISLRRMQEKFKWCFERTLINKRITLHTLRHTYATTLLSNGCPLDYVAMLLGHAKVETTRRHYVSIQHKHAKHAHFRFLTYEANTPRLEYLSNPHNIHEQKFLPKAL